MTKPLIRIYTDTDQFIDREMTDAEFEQYEMDKATAEAQFEELAKAAAAKKVAEDKLIALGLNLNDLRALGL